MRVGDWSNHLLLASGSILGPEVPSGSTYRTNTTMGHYGMSCQYWRVPEMRFMHPGLNQYLTGVGSWWWRESSSCGQCIKVTEPETDRSVVLVIGDYCPECTPRQLDMNDWASRKLNDRNKALNYQKLFVERVECDWPRGVEFKLHRDSSKWHWYIIPVFLREPLISLKCRGQAAYHDKYGRWVIEFKKDLPRYGESYTVLACDSGSCFKNDITFGEERYSEVGHEEL